MPLPKQSELPVAPNRPAAPPITPSQPSYEQQQIQLQQQQLFLMRQQAQRNSYAGQATNAMVFCLILFIGFPIGVWLLSLLASAFGY